MIEEQITGQMSIFDLGIWSGKMYPEPSAATKEKTSEPSLKKPQKLQTKMPLFLDLRGGRWTSSGCIVGNGWSIAWRVHDAQFWGVPQRRKRIALVADFGGYTAPEILFERKSLFGDIEESGKAGEGVTATSERNADPTGEWNNRGRGDRNSDSAEWNTETITFQERAGKPGGVRDFSYNMNAPEPSQPSTINQCCVAYRGDAITSPTNASNPKEGDPCHTLTDDSRNYVVYGVSAYESNAMKSANPHSGIYEADTTRTLDNNGGNPACNQGGMIVLEGNGSRDSHRGDGYKESEISYSLNTVEHHAVCVGNGQTAQTRISDKVGALNCMHDQQAVMTYGLDRASFNQGQNAQYDFSVEEEKAQTIVAKGPGGGADETVGALCARDYKGVGSQYVDEGKCIIQHSRPSNSEDR